MALVVAFVVGVAVFGIVVSIGASWVHRDDGPPLAERMT